MISIRGNRPMTEAGMDLVRQRIVRADASAAPNSKSRHLEGNSAQPRQTCASTSVIKNFAEFAGSLANAGNLVTGLAWSVPITLTAASRDRRAWSSISLAAPTGPLKISDVYVSLALARRQLANLGISRPTPEQIKATLVGGIVETDSAESHVLTLFGILTLRSQGMSWGAVAASQGVTLGRW